MERFEHLSMVAFLILGLGIVRFMTSWGALISRNIIIHDIEEQEKLVSCPSCSIFLYIEDENLAEEE